MIALGLGSPCPLVLTGGYAVRAHRLVNRLSQDLDVATQSPAPMADIATTLRVGLEARGWKVQALETTPLSARFTMTNFMLPPGCNCQIWRVWSNPLVQ